MIRLIDSRERGPEGARCICQLMPLYTGICYHRTAARGPGPRPGRWPGRSVMALSGLPASMLLTIP